MKRPEADDEQQPHLAVDLDEPKRKKPRQEGNQQGGAMAQLQAIAATGTTVISGSSHGSDTDNSAKKRPGGVILKGGRVRLPDKLMEYLSKEVVPDVLYWQKGGTSFSFDTKTAQTELLDKYFHGTKLSSFTRSLNRWGFKRIFYALSPKNVLSYEHPAFRKDKPHLVKQMKITDANNPPHDLTKLALPSPPSASAPSPPPAQAVSSANASVLASVIAQTATPPPSPPGATSVQSLLAAALPQPPQATQAITLQDLLVNHQQQVPQPPQLDVGGLLQALGHQQQAPQPQVDVGGLLQALASNRAPPTPPPPPPTLQQQVQDLMLLQQQMAQQPPPQLLPQPQATGTVQALQQALQSAVQEEQQKQAAIQIVMGLLQRHRTNNNNNNGNA